MNCTDNKKEIEMLASTRRRIVGLTHLTLVLLNVDEVAWKSEYVKEWLANHMGYKTSIVFVSPHSIGKVSNFVYGNLDEIIHVNGIVMSKQVASL